MPITNDDEPESLYKHGKDEEAKIDVCNESRARTLQSRESEGKIWY